MKTCVNCGIEIDEKRKYCSLKCRNIYVNKNLRDYSKTSESVKKKHLNNYLEKPKYCIECGNIIDYKKRENNFCNQSCFAKFNNKNRDKFVISEEGMKNLREGIKHAQKHNYPYLEEDKIKYLENPKICNECGNKLEFKLRKRKYCNRKCKNKYQRKHLTEYQKYYKDCQFKFALNDYPNEFDFSLIEKYGWYKAKNRGNNLNGVSRDHMFSVKEGFEKNIDSNLISHPANCKLMKHNDNVSKFRNSSITIEELKLRINEWNIKYTGIV